MDAIHWGPNWTPATKPELRERLDDALTAPRWVCCGNYTSVADLILSRATAVVWLNYPFPMIFFRALRRTVRRIVTGERLYAGNRETFRKAFLSHDSILLWVMTSHRRRWHRYRQLFDGPEYPHLRRIELSGVRATRRFVSTLAEPPAKAVR